MKWITRERVKVDRVACPWLIRKFIDPGAVFLFVPAEKVTERAKEESAIPFDVPGAELGHHSGRCSFEAIITKYNLADPALQLLAEIVHGADVQKDLYRRPEAPGLLAIAKGFSLLGLRDDHEILEREFIVYDALYAYCRGRVRTLTPQELRQSATEGNMLLFDVRRESDFAADPQTLPGAERRDPEQVEAWAKDLPRDKEVIIYCVRGGSVSNSVLDKLQARGIRARYLEGGLEAWKKTVK
jgi:rhodanese-related sulfurtransferase